MWFEDLQDRLLHQGDLQYYKVYNMTKLSFRDLQDIFLI